MNRSDDMSESASTGLPARASTPTKSSLASARVPWLSKS